MPQSILQRFRLWLDTRHDGTTNQPHEQILTPANHRYCVSGHPSSKPLRLNWFQTIDDGVDEPYELLPMHMRLNTFNGHYTLYVLVISDEGNTQVWFKPGERSYPPLSDEVWWSPDADEGSIELCIQLKPDSTIRAIVPAIMPTREPYLAKHWHRPIFTLKTELWRGGLADPDKGVVSFQEDMFNHKGMDAKILVPWALRYAVGQKELTLHPLELYGGVKDITNEQGHLIVKPPFFDPKGRVLMEQPFMHPFDLGWSREPDLNSSRRSSTK